MLLKIYSEERFTLFLENNRISTQGCPKYIVKLSGLIGKV